MKVGHKKITRRTSFRHQGSVRLKEAQLRGANLEDRQHSVRATLQAWNAAELAGPLSLAPESPYDALAAVCANDPRLKGVQGTGDVSRHKSDIVTHA